MGIGCLVSIPGLVAAFFFANHIGKKIKAKEDLEVEQAGMSYEDLLKSYGKLPNGFMALAPILMPIICMALGSIASAAKWPGGVGVFSSSSVVRSSLSPSV